MQAAIEQFRSNILRVRSLDGIYQALSVNTTSALDLSDLLRSEWVLAVSSLDSYIHELVKLGMLEAYRGERPRTEAFLRFQISLDSALEAISNPLDSAWLESQVVSRHGHLSFQTPDRIAEAVRLISGVRLWDEVASRLGKTNRDTREQLGLIVDRRNQIVHAADIDPSYAGRAWPIDYLLVTEAVTFIEQVAEAIHAVVV